jgi:hypothetical protein
MSRAQFQIPNDTVRVIWQGLGLPDEALQALELQGCGLGVPSSFKIGHLAEVSIGLSGLSAALLHAHRHGVAVPKVSVALQDAVTEFKSEALFTIDGKRPSNDRNPIGRLHKASGGYIRIHDGFINHREGTKRVCHMMGGTLSVV